MTVIKFSLFASQRKCSKMACNYWFGVLLLGQCLLVCSSVALHGNNIDNAERESDGAYRPRDAEHYSDAGHNVEFDHEAILGSVKEAEEFDKLSPEESKQRLAEMLPRMDLNGDGMIDRQELKKWILNSFINLSKEEADERLQEADEDKDGVVSWQEYLRDTFGTDIEAEVADDESSDSGLLISEEKAMWKAADVNLDGSLDSREFEVFNNPEEHAVMHPYLINQTLREKDRNNDGKIDFQEFIGDRGSQQDRAWLVAEREKFDHELDLDKDGSLDASEVKQWVIPNNDEIADEEVDHLFASADDDHDDLLSFLEVVSHHDVFVGSEASDGDILGDHFSDEL